MTFLKFSQPCGDVSTQPCDDEPNEWDILNGSGSLLVIQLSIMRRFKAGWQCSEVEDERNEGILEINAVKSQALRSHLQLDLGVTTRPKHWLLIRRSQNLTCSLSGSCLTPNRSARCAVHGSLTCAAVIRRFQNLREFNLRVANIGPRSSPLLLASSKIFCMLEPQHGAWDSTHKAMR
jgi:hypothetical protein